jgi:hypothetical protein
LTHFRAHFRRQGRARATTLGGKLSVPKPVNLPSIKKARARVRAGNTVA